MLRTVPRSTRRGGPVAVARRLLLGAGLGATVLGATATDAFSQRCSRPACQDDERYVAQESPDGRDYGVCRSGPNFLGHMSRRFATCPDGFELDARTGRCEDTACASGCGQVRPVCPWGTEFRRLGFTASDSFAVCGSSSGVDYRSRQIARCAVGWSLIAGGSCRKQCRTSAPIVSPIPPERVLRADLVVMRAFLRTKGSSIAAKQVTAGQSYRLCYRVTNAGALAAGPFRVTAGGLGVPRAPYEDHDGLGPDESLEGCLTYETSPSAGSYSVVLTVDSRNAVREVREDNNTRRVIVRVVP